MPKIDHILGNLAFQPDIVRHHGIILWVRLTVGRLPGYRPDERHQLIAPFQSHAHKGVKVVRPVLADGQVVPETMADVVPDQFVEGSGKRLLGGGLLLGEVRAGMASQVKKQALFEPEFTADPALSKEETVVGRLAELDEAHQRARA